MALKFFFACWVALLLPQFTVPVHASSIAQTGQTPRARYLNPNTGRFWSMDSYEGDNEAPLSFHKYVYCSASPVDQIDLSGHEGDLISLSVASSLGAGLQIHYDAGATTVGNSMMNTIIGVQAGYSIGQIVALNFLENAGGVIAGQALGKLSQLRKLPGIASGAGKIIQGGRWLRGSQGNAGFIPEQMASKLAGQKFANFDKFREAFWKLVGNDPELSSGFKPIDIPRMRNGRAPSVDPLQAVGARATYELHHVTPIQQGGDVYNVDNLIVCTPRYHQEVLEPAYHY